MLYRTYSVIAALVLFLLASCNFNKKEECARLDNHIAAINDSLLQLGADWGAELKVAVNTLNFSQLNPIRTEMGQFVDSKIAEVKEMKNVGGSEELLKTELEFLQVEKEIIADRLSVFEQFNDSVAMDALSAAYASMQIGAVKEQELLARLHKLREQYAEKNEIPKFIDRY